MTIRFPLRQRGSPAGTVVVRERALSPALYRALSDVPPEDEWLANITNPKTRRAYAGDVSDFTMFTGLRDRQDLRTVTRAHVIAWRKDMERVGLAPTSIRRRLSALSSLYRYLCERNAVAGNPVEGVKRPAANSSEGSTPVLGDAQARRLLDAPPTDTPKGVRDRAVLATLLYHGLRREELCLLRVRDIQTRQGVPHLRVHGKGSKIRFVPLHPAAQRLIAEYLALASHGVDVGGPLFRPIKNNTTKEGLRRPLHPHSVYRDIVRFYARKAGISVAGGSFGPHALRATAATNALEHDADMGLVQKWLGHASPATTNLYNRRRSRPEESPTYRVKY